MLLNINIILNVIQKNNYFDIIIDYINSETNESIDINNSTNINELLSVVDKLKIFITDITLTDTEKPYVMNIDFLSESLNNKDNNIKNMYSTPYLELYKFYNFKVVGYKNNNPITLSNTIKNIQNIGINNPLFELKGHDEKITIYFEKNSIQELFDSYNDSIIDTFIYIYILEEYTNNISNKIININELIVNENNYSYDILNTKNGNIYEITVLYKNKYGFSQKISYSVLSTLILTEPLNIDISQNINTINLKWDQPANSLFGIKYKEVYKYYIYRKKNDEEYINLSILTKNIDFDSSENIVYIDNDISSNTRYTYKIQALKLRNIENIPNEEDIDDNLNDNLISGLLSNPFTIYNVDIINVSNSKPIVQYIPIVNRNRLHYNIEKPNGSPSYNNIINDVSYNFFYDISYSYFDYIENKRLHNNIIIEVFSDNVNDIFNYIFDTSNIDISFDYGVTLEIQFKFILYINNIYYESLYTDIVYSTPYFTPDTIKNLSYEPLYNNDKSFILKWEHIIYNTNNNLFIHPYSNFIRYKIFYIDNENINNIYIKDTSFNFIRISEDDISFNYNSIYNFKIQTYINNELNIETIQSNGIINDDAYSLLSEQIDVLIFKHQDIIPPFINQYIKENDNNISINISLDKDYNYIYNNNSFDNYNSLYDISLTTFKNDSYNYKINISDISQEFIFDNIEFGNTLSYSIYIEQIYRGFKFNSQKTDTFIATPYSKPSAPVNININSTIYNSGKLIPLSVNNNGKLMLTWEPILKYDSIDNIDTKHTKKIKYRILDIDNNIFKDNINNTYENIEFDVSFIIIENLFIGKPYLFKIQSYYINEEINNNNTIGIVNGGISVQNPTNNNNNIIVNIPFFYPNKIINLSINEDDIFIDETDNRKHNIKLSWINLDEINYAENGGLPSYVFYKIYIKSLDNYFENNININDINTNNFNILNLYNNNLYEIYITSNIKYNNNILTSTNSISDKIYFILPSNIENIIVFPYDINEGIKISWDNHKYNGNAKLLNYEYIFTPNGDTNIKTTSSNQLNVNKYDNNENLETGLLHKFYINSKFTYTNQSKVYTFRSKKLEISDRRLIPYGSPILSDLNVNNNVLFFKLDNNGSSIISIDIYLNNEHFINYSRSSVINNFLSNNNENSINDITVNYTNNINYGIIYATNMAGTVYNFI